MSVVSGRSGNPETAPADILPVPAAATPPVARVGQRPGRLDRSVLSSVDRDWQESLKLTMKLMAFREALPVSQQGLLDSIMRRAQMASNAGLTDVAGYTADTLPAGVAGEVLLALDGYFAELPVSISPTPDTTA